MEVSTKNRFGQYVASIPEPFEGIKKRCHCGATFWSADAYRGHYALVHVLGLSDKKFREHNPYDPSR